MTVATTSPAGQAVAANAHARRLAAGEEARRHAREDLAANRADTTTPLTASAAPAPARAFRFSHDIRFKGRVITVYADGMTLSEFSALLDAHGVAPADGDDSGV